jgi:choline dehydrogenase-like flavoprotein
MLVDLASLGEADEFDVCIVGAGPAGITCARSLAKAGKRVLLLEGGGQDYSDASQALYQGEVVGDPYEPLDVNRLRYLGGASNHWAGYCRALDAWDFDRKTGDIGEWPIAKTDLDPHAAEARGILDLAAPRPDAPFGDSGLNHIDFTYSAPTLFGQKYGEELARSARIFLALDANLYAIRTNGAAVTGLTVKGPDGAKTTVRARRYVLAMGGIENVRLLLWSDALANGALVRSPVLGKYYMDHLDFFIGEALMSTSLATPYDDEGLFHLAPSPETMQRHGSLACGIRVQDTSYAGTKKMIVDMACVAPDLARRAFDLLGRELLCGKKLVAVWEQEPVESNRIELSDARDALGMPRVRLFWTKSADDKRTGRVAAEVLGAWLARNDLGRVRLVDWMVDDAASFPADNLCVHHMGGARMADDPARGVVDADCRVFGAANLYALGASAFSSGGHANPTLTIVQLALRLGAHLAGKV